MAFQERRGHGGGGGFRGGSSGPREMHDATCADCGAETQVPFRPSGERPVYCRDCFPKHRESGGGGGGRGGGGGGRGGFGGDRGPREMHDATCSKCGTATQVPFRPTEGRPVYCRDCFSDMRDSRF